MNERLDYPEATNLPPEHDLIDPEEALRLEISAALGAYNKVHLDDALTQDEKNQRDDVIFGSLKQTIQKAETLQSIALIDDIRARIQFQEHMCDGDHGNPFSEQLDRNGIFTDRYNHAYDAKNDKNDDDDIDPKTGKKRKRGWFSLLP